MCCKTIGEPSLPNETEMRKLIEQSLISNGAVDQPPHRTKSQNSSDNYTKDLVQENLQTQQHYESSCVVESKSYFGSEFDSEKHNSELMYEDLPKPITEFNKNVISPTGSNIKIVNGTKCKESSR